MAGLLFALAGLLPWLLALSIALALALLGSVLGILLPGFGRGLVERQLTGSSGNLICVRTIRSTGAGAIRGVLIQEA